MTLREELLDVKKMDWCYYIEAISIRTLLFTELAEIFEFLKTSKLEGMSTLYSEKERIPLFYPLLAQKALEALESSL